VGAGSASAGSGPGTGTPAGAARGLAECLRQAGIEAALAQGAGGRELGVVEIRAGRDVWLAAPGAGVIFRGVGLASLQDAPELQARFGVSPEDAAALRLALPVSAADFFSRTRVLGYVLREALGAAAPCLGESPTLRLEFWRTQQCLALPPQPGAGGRSAEAGQARLPVVLEVAGLSPVPQL